jgi:hypothetical protein
MTNRLPPVSPASRSPKGPGSQAEPPTSMDRKRADQVPGRRQAEHNQRGLPKPEADERHGSEVSRRVSATTAGGP